MTTINRAAVLYNNRDTRSDHPPNLVVLVESLKDVQRLSPQIWSVDYYTFPCEMRGSQGEKIEIDNAGDLLEQHFAGHTLISVEEAVQYEQESV